MFKLNNKGFSLLEVLVGVSIIGIISAIAIPTYQNYTKQASRTAADTTISNIGKAFNSCLVLNSFSSCISLSAIGITCPDCDTSVDSDSAPTTFCGQIEKDVSGEKFNACVQVKRSHQRRTYGGLLIEDGDYCHVTKTSHGTCKVPFSGAKSVMAPLKTCTTDANCGKDVTTGANACREVYKCEAIVTTGKCASGVCL